MKSGKRRWFPICWSSFAAITTRSPSSIREVSINPLSGADMEDNRKKQIPLRLSPKLYDAIAAWAEDDFRSINGQIEYLLSECVRQRKKNGKYVSDQIDVPPELDL